MRFPRFVPFVIYITLNTLTLFAQSPNGNINGLVSDPSSAAVAGAEVVAVNDVTRVQYTTKTNSEGIYVLANLPPGPYSVQVSKIGFKTLIKPDIVLNVQDSLSINFNLLVGAFHEIVTVQGGAPLVNTENATVSTVVDRQFAENLPMNGRSFQTLIYLTPGVVATPSTLDDSGQFSVNGQRATSNYWMVDGVSANIGISAGFNPGNGFGGTLGSFSALGGTNSLVSVDAMQEFRIQTSTFAPEFGRTPGGQISIATRSGTNQFHGTVFDYLRNDVFDANNWFNGYTNDPALPKAEERQNDFGGTIGGPIVPDKTFFFFSYEGLRLRLPQTTLTNVPDSMARQNAVATMKPYLNAFPLPNGVDDATTGIAKFDATYSNPASLDAFSLRLDHSLNHQWTFFGRYNYSPSSFTNRGGGSGFGALSFVEPSSITTQTATAAAIWNISSSMTNDLRFNYSRTNAHQYDRFDSFGGAVPLTALPFPAPYTTGDSEFTVYVFSLGVGEILNAGKFGYNVQRQINVVDGLSRQQGPHTLKWGVDVRRLSPTYNVDAYQQQVGFGAVSDFEAGNTVYGIVLANNPVTSLFHNLGVYGQDNWRATRRLTLTYGVRWDVDFAPSSQKGPAIPAVTGYSLTDLSRLAIAPAGTPPFKTTYNNLAPRLGLAYQVSESAEWQSVFRGGFGVFYDLVSSEAGNILVNKNPPIGSFNASLGGSPFPFSPIQTSPPPIPSSGTIANFTVFNPALKLPYTLQWNVAFEQSLAREQSIAITYVGATGRRLLQSTNFINPVSNPNIQNGIFIDNTSRSDYNALQIRFQRRLSRGLQALGSYAWSHSIDNASASSYGSSSNEGVPGQSRENRGNSDFDTRSTLNAAVTYDFPTLQGGPLIRAMLSGWSTENLFLMRTAPPVDLSDVAFFEFESGTSADVRPDVVRGTPFYVYGAQYPGRKALNPNAFVNPPSDSKGNPLRQGNLGRNVLRGFGATQWDFAVHRDFPIHESVKVQFRAEMFNLLNHPNFGPPSNQFGAGGFGLATQTLAQSLSSGGLGSGGFSSLYQMGGPRSIQLALKLFF